MKKIIFIALMLSMFNSVKALEYGVWTDEVSTEPEDEISSREIRYRWYKEGNLSYSTDYYIEGENDPSYPYISYNHSSTTEWSEWHEKYPELKANRIIDYKTVHRYRTLRPIKYLFVRDFENFFENTKITEINVLINGVEVPINIACNNCDLSFKEYISDGLNDVGINIFSNTNIEIDLGDYYEIYTITLEIYFYDSICDTKKFNVYYNEGNSINNQNYAIKTVQYTTNFGDDYYLERITVKPDAESITNPVFNDWIYIDGMVNATYYRQMQILSFYHYKDTLFKYYKIERDYLDGYYNSMSDSSYIKDDDSAKTFYIYDYVSDEYEDVIEENENEQVTSESQDKGSDDYNKEEDYSKESNVDSKVNNVANVKNKNAWIENKRSEEKEKEKVVALNNVSKDKKQELDNQKTDVSESRKLLLVLKNEMRNLKLIVIGNFMLIFVSVIYMIKHRILSYQK